MFNVTFLYSFNTNQTETLDGSVLLTIGPHSKISIDENLVVDLIADTIKKDS